MDSAPCNDLRRRVIVDPWAGRGAGERSLPRVEGVLRGLHRDLGATEVPHHAAARPAKVADEGWDVVVAERATEVVKSVQVSHGGDG
jgi:hypothetical protein